MSGSKRDQRAGVNVLKRATGTSDAPTLKDFAAAGYGTLDLPDSVSSETIPLSQIRPDPTQPRRTVPSSVRLAAKWNSESDAASLHRLFQEWFDAASAECGEALVFSFDDLGSSQPTRQDELEHDLMPQNAGYITEALVEIVALAMDIYVNGLIYPISIAGIGDNYQIEDGEGRWFAYQYMLLALKDKKWERIPSIIQQQSSVWRQGSGNNVRRGLDTIAKARQYAKLMMAAYQERDGITFSPLDTFEHEREYYAQVLDSRYESAPYGMRPRILRTMGLKGPAELTRCRQLLGLPNAVWTLGDDMRVSQALLLECVGLPEEVALEKIRSFHDGTIQTPKSNKSGAGGKQPESDHPPYIFAPADRKRFAQLAKITETHIRELSREARSQMLEELKLARERIDLLESMIAAD